MCVFWGEGNAHPGRLGLIGGWPSVGKGAFMQGLWRPGPGPCPGPPAASGPRAIERAAPRRGGRTLPTSPARPGRAHEAAGRPAARACAVPRRRVCVSMRVCWCFSAPEGGDGDGALVRTWSEMGGLQTSNRRARAGLRRRRRRRRARGRYIAQTPRVQQPRARGCAKRLYPWHGWKTGWPNIRPVLPEGVGVKHTPARGRLGVAARVGG